MDGNNNEKKNSQRVWVGRVLRFILFGTQVPLECFWGTQVPSLVAWGISGYPLGISGGTQAPSLLVLVIPGYPLSIYGVPRNQACLLWSYSGSTRVPPEYETPQKRIPEESLAERGSKLEIRKNRLLQHYFKYQTPGVLLP